ncbi:imidazole glycerol phosphate synthase subunit HisH [Ferrimonas futtsuensis]|uniref:imidazole glycerol phosphate synthase subunit HisH n=1 Tax=Ferrimonas futtsuensis TaxID=364764 RepID=UPI000420D342|nr:imidazole glycerol phosphate synthase subunit HisH [Ferrimonas futtsuensis]
MSQDAPKVTIIDTGCANLASVRFALARLGAEVTVSRDPEVILASPRLILPGVGSAGAGMAALKQSGVLDTLTKVTQPLLGICLGMQLLGLASEESATGGEQTPMTGLLPFKVAQLDTAGQPLPHMGWNTLAPSDHPLFKGIDEGSYVYFVHSYAAPVGELTLASSDYGQPFSAAVGRDNLMGVQFHPERSGAVGAKILSNFLEMTA